MRASITSLNTALRHVPVWPVYAGSIGYPGWMLWRGVADRLGAEPVKVLEHALGEAALYMLVAGLAITPLRRLAGLNLLKFRRAVGLACFFFVVMHLLTWAVLDVQRLDEVWADILKRPYITIGMAGFFLLVPLALTSNNRAVRWLGPRWRTLHMLVYPAAVLGALHYVWLAKGVQLRPMIFLALVIVLLALRWRPVGGAVRRRGAAG